MCFYATSKFAQLLSDVIPWEMPETLHTDAFYHDQLHLPNF